MKIAIYAPEHLAVLRSSLKFFHPRGWKPRFQNDHTQSDNICSFIVFTPSIPPQEEDRSELGEHPSFEYRQIFDVEGLSEIKSAIESGEISFLIFDSLRAHQIWLSARESKPSTLYLNPRFMILDGSIQSIRHCSWISVSNLNFCKLRGEETPSEQNIIVHESAAHWQEQPDSILLSSNHALISYLLKVHSLETRILHLEQQIPCLNLNLGSTAEALREERVHSMLKLAENILSEQSGYVLDGSWKLSELGSSGTAYTFFASIYDDYMSHVDYEMWIRSIIKWQKKYGHNKPAKILEIACGTANISGLLAFDGFAVDACDSSWQMLSEADKKLFKPRLFLRSMTEPLPALDYDLVLCLFDSINYLQKKSEISYLLQNIYAALKPGGLFIFDISTLLNSQENFADSLNFTRDATGYLVHHADYEEYSCLQKSHLFHFRKTLAGFEMESENHVQRVYRLHELLALIDASPLKLLALHVTENPSNLIQKRHSPLDEKYPRLFFVLQR